MSDIGALTTKLHDITAVTANRASIVRRAEQIRNHWAHDIPDGVDWTEALTREYWGAVIERFRAGDRVEVHSFDHKIQFTMLILDVNTATNPMFLDAVFLPVYPPDLRLPALPPQFMPRYAVRQAPGSSLFNVVDLETGLSVVENPRDRNAAQELMATLERGIALSAEQLATDFARHLAMERAADVTLAVADEADVSPGALRTRKYRERQRSRTDAA